MSDKTLFLKVTACDNYEGSDSQVVPINSSQPIEFDSSIGKVTLNVRIQGFKGTPDHKSNSHPTSEYFTLPDKENVNISIEVHLTPSIEINGDDLLFGNDFDDPIRDLLPYGASAGFRFFKWAIDPSVSGDIYCDKPFLYGKALSSFNVVHMERNEKLVEPLTENLSDETADGLDIPLDSAQRQKFFLTEGNRKQFSFKPENVYMMDFFNSYLSLKDSNFKIALPGFELDLSRYFRETSGKIRSVNFVLKKKGVGQPEGVEFSSPALVVKFELMEISEKKELSLDEVD